MQIHALLWMGIYCFELSTSVFIVALDTPPCSVQLLDYDQRHDARSAKEIEPFQVPL